MLKVIGSEIQANYYMLQRIMLLVTRTKGIPKSEPNGISVSGGRHDQRRLLRNDVDVYQEASQVLDFVNLKKSKGNYVVDADGNTLLDLCGTELNPLGYNHEAFVNALHAKEFDQALINSNLTSNEVASAEFQSLVNKVMGPIAPSEYLNAVTFTRGGQAVEKAILTAMAERGPGSWTALGFQESTHGNHTSFALAQFRGTPPKLPSLNWPVHPYPAAKNEASVLDDVHTSLKSQRSSGKPVAAVVIEPLHSTSGNATSERFLNELRSITKDSEAALIIDASETGCGATGKGFWGYPTSVVPDYLVFGKRTQVEGFFSSSNSKHFSVALGGDHLRLL
jgi:4-aminobutyrate aminotransferase/(S)-3-amino-2-methylpropionate transaminase